MEREALISNHQLKTIMTAAFSQIGNDLGNVLYNIENMNLNNNRGIQTEQNNDAVANELNVILANSYKHLLTNISVALKDCENLYKGGFYELDQTRSKLRAKS